MNARPFTVVPLTRARFDDLDGLFAARGCSEARRCWCMFYRRTGRGWLQAAETRPALRALAGGREPPGLVAYRDDAPVGWVSLGPRADFARLARSTVMGPVDGADVWSLVCFVVPSAHRGHGVAKALLAAAIDHARARGAAILEAYPIDADDRVPRDGPVWFGFRSMFDEAGFVEVARRRPTRPVMRLALASP